jgi:hypothetical protein
MIVIKKSLGLFLSFLVLLCLTASIIVVFSAPVSVAEAQDLELGWMRITGCDCPQIMPDCGCKPDG